METNMSVLLNSQEESKPTKTQMNALSVDQAILDIFTVLAIASKQKRISSVEDLINRLKEKQNDQIEACGELEYCIKRLIKGLSSTRKWVRIGFPLALCQVLRQFPQIKLVKVLEMIEEHLDPSKAGSIPEKSNFEVGKGYALSCLIQSGSIFQDKKETGKLLSKLIQFKSEKSYVNCIWNQNIPLLVTKLVFQRPKTDECLEYVWPTLEKYLAEGWNNLSPERLEVLFVCKLQCPEKIDKSFLNKNWNSEHIVNSKTHEKLLAVVKESTRGHPVIHDSNKFLVREVINSDKVYGFWKEIVEKLFHEDSHKKRLGMFFLSELLKSVKESKQMKMFMSSQVCEMLYVDLKLSEKNMSSAQMVIDSLETLLESVKDDDLHLSLLQSLLTPVSIIKTFNAELGLFLSAILPHLTAGSVELFGKEIMTTVEGKTLFGIKIDGENLFLRKWAVGQLFHLLHHPGNVTEMVKWQGTILQFVFRHAYFTLLKPSDILPHCEEIGAAFPVQLVQFCQNMFTKCFFKVITQKTSKTNKDAIMLTAHQLFSYVESLIKNKEIVKPLKDLDEETIAALLKTKKMMQKLESKKNVQESSKDICAFELLLIYLALQIFCDPQNCLDVIEDTLSCCDRALRKTKKSRKNEPDWIQVLMEVLIGMMANPTKLSRIIALNIFSAVVERVTLENVAQITEILTKNASNLNDDEDLYFEGEEGEEVEEAESGDNEGEEEEMENEEEDSTDEEEEEEEEESMEVDEEFRQKVKAALGDAVVGSDEEDDDLPDLSDDEMIRRDEALVTAFRSMNKKKINKTERDKRQQLLTLKIRLLDLITEIIKYPQPAQVILALHIPLLEVRESSLRNKDEKTLGSKVTSLYQEMCKCKVKPETVAALPVEEIQNQIQSLVTFSRNASSVDLIIDVSEGILSLIKILNNREICPSSKECGISKTYPVQFQKSVLDPLLPSLNNFLENQGYHHHLEFFKNLFEKQILVFWSQNQFLLEIISDENQKIMKRTKACGLLLSMIDRKNRQIVKKSDWQTFASYFVPAILKLLDSGEGKVKFLEQVLRLFNSFMTVDKGDNLALLPASLFPQLQKIKKSSSKDNKKLAKSIAQQLRHHGLKPAT